MTHSHSQSKINVLSFCVDLVVSHFVDLGKRNARKVAVDPINLLLLCVTLTNQLDVQ